MEVDAVLEEIRKNAKDGNVVFLTIEGFVGAKLSNFIQQPADGILYDLNRDKITTITLAKAGEIDKRWVNDYAVATTIEYMHGEIARLKAENAKLREFVLFLVKLSVNMMYEGNMPTIDEIDALMESSKEWLDEDEWRSYFVS